MDHSPDGLNYSVYTGNNLLAKFADKIPAINYAASLAARNIQQVRVNQYDSDYSPHLGRKIYP